ncbi:transposase [Planomonospora sp. ID67723]|nr:transposase [Planomonospora sp. ID67723]
MARGFRRVDRDQQFLLPVDMREWLPDDHVVWVLLEVVEHLDVAALEARYAQSGPGRRAYDPRMLLSLLIYAYSAGVRSSRQIERLCRTDVAMRVICGLQVPDHTVIARFRQRHQHFVQELFTQVLLICAKAGLGRLGAIAVDGTKITANAALLVHQARCLGQCPKLDRCCLTSATCESGNRPRGCDDTDCPCLADWIGTLLFDAGYWTQDNLTVPGPDRLIAPGKNAARPQPGQDHDRPPQNADPATLMIHRLATEEGAALYRRRGATVEPVNAHLKDRTALRRFARRGLAACQAELIFAELVLNIGEFCRLAPARRSAALTV